MSDISDKGAGYAKNLLLISDMVFVRSAKPWLYLDSIYWLLGYTKQVNKIVEPIHAFGKEIIEKRRAILSNTSEQNVMDDNENISLGMKQKFSVLDTLLQAQKDGLIDEDGIREETITFVIAGHDTVTSSIMFTLMLLANYPDVQQKVYEEICGVGSNGEPNFDDFNKFEYTERVIKESLRLYPPGPIMSRKLSEDFVNGK